MRITYFANDLTDPALVRRVRLLRIGGAELTILGFRRSATPVPAIDGIPAIDLGRTFDGQLAARAWQILRHSLRARKWRDLIADTDVLLARNLDMATIADAARVWACSRVPLAYECLDIHRAVLGPRLPAKLLRGWERRVLRRSATLTVSSPAYITNYFARLKVALPDVILAENKLVRENPVDQRPSQTSRRPPWRIGWFGYLRCIESFKILLGLAQRHPTLVDIQLRGRPILELQARIAAHLPLPNMRFGGAYGQSDLPTVYSDCDLVWAIEYFRRGQNSDWALSNRMYEGSYFNRPVITLAGTAGALWLEARHAGVALVDPHVDLDPFIETLTSADYDRLQLACSAIATTDLVWTIDASRRFVQQITRQRLTN